MAETPTTTPPPRTWKVIEQQVNHFGRVSWVKCKPINQMQIHNPNQPLVAQKKIRAFAGLKRWDTRERWHLFKIILKCPEEGIWLWIKCNCYEGLHQDKAKWIIEWNKHDMRAVQGRVEKYTDREEFEKRLTHITNSESLEEVMRLFVSEIAKTIQRMRMKGV